MPTFPPFVESESAHRTVFSFPDVEEMPNKGRLMFLFAFRVRVWSPPEDLTMFVLKTIAPTVPVVATFVTRVSMVTFLKASSAAKAEAWIFEAAAVGVTHTPSMNEPLELALVLIVTSVARNVGVTVNEVPIKASAVTVNTWSLDTPLWKPMFEKVATPFLEVVVVEVMLVVVPPIVC